MLEAELCSESTATGLALLVSNSTAMVVTQDGETIYTSAEGGYQRNQTVPLRDFTGTSRLRISYSGGDYSNTPDRHILLGSLDSIHRDLNLVSQVNGFFLGLLFLMLLGSLVLYARKGQERYLLHLALAAGLSMLNMAISMQSGGGTVSWSFTIRLRSAVLALCPWQLMMMLRSLEEQTGDRALTGAAHVLYGLGVLIAVLALTGISPSGLSYINRWTAAVMDVAILARACREKRRDAVPLLLACGVMEGLCLASLISANMLPYGRLFGLFRVIELAHGLFLMMAMLAVYIRFADHFRHEEELKRQLETLNETLEERVTLRTRELQEQQDRRQTTMQNIFHDVRSPLLVLRTQVDALPEAVDSKRTMQDRLAYLTRLTEELFLVSNLEAHNVLFDEDDVDLPAILTEVADGLRSRCREKRVTVALNAEPLMAWGDSFRLRQALQNLADNALKHVNEGGAITLSLRRRNGQTEIIVHNTGSYIPPEELDAVFERYYRSKKRHDPHSSGLGLSIAREIVAAHEGSIRVESSLETGTAFVVTLPPAVAAEDT